jgi:hypothetical protein
MMYTYQIYTQTHYLICLSIYLCIYTYAQGIHTQIHKRTHTLSLHTHLTRLWLALQRLTNPKP